jgi:2-polyprenyl-3-methyl-5-hydroxy-6-metoxy-1,4-benzoquinol methylase
LELIHVHSGTGKELYKGAWVRAAPGTHEACATIIDRYVPVERRPSAAVLEMGAGEGAFSLRLLDMGFRDITAWELDASTVTAPVSRAESVDLNSDFGADAARLFDLVVAVEVLEHLENPWAFMRACSRILAPGGLLLVSSPNIESAASRIEFLRTGRLMWFHDEDVPESGHITPIGRWQIALAARRAGLCVVEATSNAEDTLVTAGRHRTGRPKAVIALLAFPFMKGSPRGEIGVWAILRDERSARILRADAHETAEPLSGAR